VFNLTASQYCDYFKRDLICKPTITKDDISSVLIIDITAERTRFKQDLIDSRFIDSRFDIAERVKDWLFQVVVEILVINCNPVIGDMNPDCISTDIYNELVAGGNRKLIPPMLIDTDLSMCVSDIVINIESLNNLVPIDTLCGVIYVPIMWNNELDRAVLHLGKIK